MQSANIRENEAGMRYRMASIVACVSISCLMVSPAVALTEQNQEQPKNKKAPAKAQQASLTGCIDEENGQYILIHDQTRNPIANLVADGFPTEGFAKHLGHKVTVRGTASPNGAERPAFKVRSIDTISESCGQHEN